MGQLRPQVFEVPSLRYGLPQVDQFATPPTAQLSPYMSFNHATDAGSPDSFTEDWSTVRSHLSIPAPSSSSPPESASDCTLLVSIAVVWGADEVVLFSPPPGVRIPLH